jgi:hypothetical protein
LFGKFAVASGVLERCAEFSWGGTRYSTAQHSTANSSTEFCAGQEARNPAVFPAFHRDCGRRIGENVTLKIYHKCSFKQTKKLKYLAETEQGVQQAMCCLLNCLEAVQSC